MTASFAPVPGMRVPPLTALTVFAGFAAFCAGLVALVLIGDPAAVLSAAAAAAVSGGGLGWLLMPRVVFNTASAAMFIGGLIALLSHVPFSILWGLGAGFLDGSLDEAIPIVFAVILYGYIFAAIPQLILGALAGYVSYRHAVPAPSPA